MAKSNIQKAVARRKRALSTFTSAVQELTVAEAELDQQVEAINREIDELQAQRFHAEAERRTTKRARVAFSDLLGIEG